MVEAYGESVSDHEARQVKRAGEGDPAQEWLGTNPPETLRP